MLSGKKTFTFQRAALGINKRPFHTIDQMKDMLPWVFSCASCHENIEEINISICCYPSSINLPTGGKYK